MKKLMIAAAIVCAAACAQAESFYWDFTGEVPTAVGKGLYSGDMTVTCEALGYTKTVTVDGGYFTYDEDIESEEGVNYTFTLTGETDTHSYLATSVGTCGGAISEVRFEAGTWTEKPGPEPIPEPTSALLMLLGMAGLALKRKRA